MQSFSARCNQRVEGYKTQLQWIFSTPQVDSGPRTRVDLCISLTITQIFYVARCRASENHIGNFRRTPALSAEGASGKLSTQGCRGKHRIQADGHSITYYNDSDSLLTRPRNKKTGRVHLSVALLLQSESSSLTDTDGGTDRLCAAERNSIVDFGSTETLC